MQSIDEYMHMHLGDAIRFAVRMPLWYIDVHLRGSEVGFVGGVYRYTCTLNKNMYVCIFLNSYLRKHLSSHSLKQTL